MLALVCVVVAAATAAADGGDSDNLYVTLGLTQTATTTDIQKAYRQLAKGIANRDKPN